jgi:hypothetical protein
MGMESIHNHSSNGCNCANNRVLLTENKFISSFISPLMYIFCWNDSCVDHQKRHHSNKSTLLLLLGQKQASANEEAVREELSSIKNFPYSCLKKASRRTTKDNGCTVL